MITHFTPQNDSLSSESLSSFRILSFLMKNTKSFFDYADNNTIRSCDMWESAFTPTGTAR